MDQVVRHLAGYDYQRATFLEAHIRATNQQVVGCSRSDAPERPHGTRHNGHARIVGRTARAFRKKIVHIEHAIGIIKKSLLPFVFHDFAARPRHNQRHTMSEAFQVHRRTRGVNGPAGACHTQDKAAHLATPPATVLDLRRNSTRNATPKKQGFTCTSSNPFFSARATKPSTGKKRSTELTRYS